MKAMFEHVVPELHQPWRFGYYQWSRLDVNLHYHPEYELVLTCGSAGLRQVGGTVHRYSDFDLVLVGPNVVHSWHSDGGAALQHTYVVQLPADFLHAWIGANPALSDIVQLLQQAACGVWFPPTLGQALQPLFAQLDVSDVVKRQVLLLELLWRLAQCPQRCLLHKGHADSASCDPNQRRMAKLTHYIQQQLAMPLAAEQLAEVVHLSVPHLHRLFKQYTEMTLWQYVLQQRIHKACRLLQDTRLSIAMIAGQCGFHSLASFNRQFLKSQQCTPRQYRTTKWASGISPVAQMVERAVTL